MNSWIRILEKLLVVKIVKKFPLFYGTSNFITIYMTEYDHLHRSCCVLRKMHTSSEALLKERQTTDILLVSAQLQDVTVDTITSGKTVKRPKNAKIYIPF
jgi:hypothetical protein